MEKSKSIYTGPSVRYGITNGFSTLLTMVASTYFAFYLSSVVKIETATMATIITVSSLVDLISVPVVAVLLQKMKFKKGGKLRPWLLIGGVGAALLRWLNFTNIGLTGASQAIWFAGTYILSYFFFNLAYSAFTGILPLMAKTPSDRVAFASTRIVFNSVGKFLFSLSSIAVINAFGGRTSATGYSVLALVIAVLVAFGFWQLFMGTKEYDVIETIEVKGGKTKDQYDASIWEMIKCTITKPFVLYLVGASCKGTTYFIITGLTAYYYSFVVNDMNMMALYMTLSTFLMIVGAALTPYASKFFKGSRNAFALGLLVYGLVMGTAYFLGKTALPFTIIMSTAFLFYSVGHSAEAAVYSFVVDYTQWKSGKDLKPFMMSLFSLVPKIGTTIGAAILGYGLVAVDFNSKLKVQTPGAIEGIRGLLSALPAILAVVGALAIFLCPLTEQKIAEMHAEFTKRNAEKAAAKAAAQ
jgi:GPH family glycoside/pentoside/hexuronide:cation symporter